MSGFLLFWLFAVIVVAAVLAGQTKGTVQVGVRTFDYGEIGKTGSLKRTMYVVINGVAGAKMEFGFDPNPHKSPYYNNKKQPEFYETMAWAIAKSFDADTFTFPVEQSVTFYDLDFKVTLLTDQPKKPAPETDKKSGNKKIKR